MDEFVRQLAVNVVRQKDQLIEEAITSQIGNQWSVEEIDGRGTIKVLPDKTEIFAFDGVDLIHFYHIKTVMDYSRVGVSAKATQEYRLLY